MPVSAGHTRPSRLAAALQRSELLRAGDWAAGTLAECYWGAACLPCRGGGPSGHPPPRGLLAFAETLLRRKESPGIHGHPLTLPGSLPASRLGSAPA